MKKMEMFRFISFLSQHYFSGTFCLGHYSLFSSWDFFWFRLHDMHEYHGCFWTVDVKLLILLLSWNSYSHCLWHSFVKLYTVFVQQQFFFLFAIFLTIFSFQFCTACKK